MNNEANDVIAVEIAGGNGTTGSTIKTEHVALSDPLPFARVKLSNFVTVPFGVTKQDQLAKKRKKRAYTT